AEVMATTVRKAREQSGTAVLFRHDARTARLESLGDDGFVREIDMAGSKSHRRRALAFRDRQTDQLVAVNQSPEGRAAMFRDQIAQERGVALGRTARCGEQGKALLVEPRRGKV